MIRVKRIVYVLVSVNGLIMRFICQGAFYLARGNWCANQPPEKFQCCDGFEPESMFSLPSGWAGLLEAWAGSKTKVQAWHENSLSSKRGKLAYRLLPSVTNTTHQRSQHDFTILQQDIELRLHCSCQSIFFFFLTLDSLRTPSGSSCVEYA